MRPAVAVSSPPKSNSAGGKLEHHMRTRGHPCQSSGAVGSAEKAATAYEAVLARKGVDLQMLRIGQNGHIGFNEPGTAFVSTTHRAALTESTRRANARFFSAHGVVPGEALTRGLATIMRATRIELIAAGAHEAAAVARALHGPITEQCPASILQRHPDVHVSLDHDAAARLREQKKGGFGRT